MQCKSQKAIERVRSRSRLGRFGSNMRLLVLLAAIVSLNSIAFAQTGFSGLRGNVEDSSGAAIPGAKVVLMEPATGETLRTAVSNAQGDFEFPNLKPGTYEVKSSMTGFKSFVADDVKLDADQIRRLDVKLAVGSVQETVEVVAGAALIHTEGGTISGTIDKKAVADTPLLDTYPSPNSLLVTLPGVQGNGWDMKISGQDSSQQSMEMDGVSNDRAGEQSNTSKFLDEATVVTVNAPADSARVVAYNLTSKRGGNAFHGMAYYQHFNGGLDATPHPNTQRQAYLQHDWQAELLGPIWKNHTFFYASWYEQLIPGGTYNLATVPTQAMWSGNFKGFAPIIDPQTGKPFPNNIIPANRISPVATALEKYYPQPNLGDPRVFQANNFGWEHPFSSENYRGDWPFIRIDHNISKKNSIFVRWLDRRTPFVLPGNLPTTFWTRMRDYRQTAVEDTHIFTPTVLNTFRFGYNTDFMDDGAVEHGQRPLNGGDVIAALGLQGLNPSNYNVAGVPSFSINGISPFSAVRGGVKNDDKNYFFEESVTWQKGRHVWKFGGEMTAFRFHTGVVPDYGSFSFNGSFTGGAPGSAFADLLLGLPHTSERSDPLVNRRQRNKELGFYAMDTFKLTPRLTLDYGLRWDYYGIPTYDDGLMYNFDLATGTVLVPRSKLSQVNPEYPTNIPIAVGQVTPNASLGNFRPRLSVAYMVSNGFVIRGGYGQYTERFSRYYSDQADNQGPGPFAHLAENYTNQLVNGQPLFSFPKPFPSPTLAAAAPSQYVAALPNNWQNGTIHQYNVTLEKQVGRMGLRASYIGSRSVGMNYVQWNMDVAPASTKPFDISLEPYPNLSDVAEYRHDGAAKYDSLQLEATRKQGWATFDAHYTWASSLNNMQNTDDISNPTKEWAFDPGLRRNLFTFTSLLNLPFGKGRAHMSHAPLVVEEALGGWGIQSISYLGSGDYMTPRFYGFDVANNNYNSSIADVIPGKNGNLPSSQRTEQRWFNTPVYHQDPVTQAFVYDQIGAFKVPGCLDTDPLCLNNAPSDVGRYGNAHANTLLGPRLDVHHLSVFKSFPIAEKVNATFTSEISDIFNHPLFYDPDTYINAPDVGQLVYARGDYEPEKAGHRQISFKLRFEF